MVLRTIFSIVLLLAGFTGASGQADKKTDLPLLTVEEPFTKQIEVPPDAKILEFSHRFGTVTLIGWDKPFILVEGTKKLTAKDTRAARLAAEAIQIVAFEAVPNRLIMQFQGPGSSTEVDVKEKVINFVAHIPRWLALDLDFRHGLVTLSNFQSAVLLDHRNGDVKAENIEGKLQIRSKTGNITVNNAGKTLRMDTSEGTVHVDRVAGDFALQHQKGDVQVTNVGGTAIFNCYEAPIFASDIRGRLEIDSRRGDVECRRFQQALDVNVYHGILKAEPEKTLDSNYYCRVDDGEMILRIPEESSVLFEVNVENGRIHSDFYMPVWSEGKVSVAKGATKEGRNFISCWAKKRQCFIA